MCQTCWKAVGAPKINNEKTKQLSQLINELYKEEKVGGCLHIVVDDWNLENGDLKFCQTALKRKFNNINEGTARIQQHCLDQLFICTKQERASGLALAKGFWST